MNLYESIKMNLSEAKEDSIDNATVIHSDEPDIVLKLDSVDNANDFISVCDEMGYPYKVKDDGEVKYYIINASGKDYSFTFNDAGLRIY